MKITTVGSYTASIYVGLRESYTDVVRSPEMANEWLRKYANKGGICVTVSETLFIYTDGGEPGIVIGLINYPRFPSSSDEIKAKALEIAGAMLVLFKQRKVSVVFPDETVMVSNEGL